jgi:hypothetical protein
VITGFPVPGRAVVSVVLALWLLVVAVAALLVELVVVRVVVVTVVDEVVRALPQATHTTAVRRTAARRVAVGAVPGKRIEAARRC